MPVYVHANPSGVPLRVRRGQSGLAGVTQIRDRWRVDTQWWREPVSRMYWELGLSTGEVLTLYRDLVTNAWYVQPYGERG